MNAFYNIMIGYFFGFALGGGLRAGRYVHDLHEWLQEGHRTLPAQGKAERLLFGFDYCAEEVQQVAAEPG